MNNLRELADKSAASSKPYAWTTPGTDEADCNGFIPCNIHRGGELTKPLYLGPQPTLDEMQEELHNEIARLREALRDIAYRRPPGPCRNQTIIDIEKIALTALNGPVISRKVVGNL